VKPRARLELEAVLGEKLAVKGRVSPLGGALAAGLRVEVLLLEDGLVTKVPRGENGGQTLEEGSVVRALARPLELARARSEPESFEAELAVPEGSKREQLHVAAVLREASTWRVLQALDVALVASR